MKRVKGFFRMRTERQRCKNNKWTFSPLPTHFLDWLTSFVLIAVTFHLTRRHFTALRLVLNLNDPALLGLQSGSSGKTESKQEWKKRWQSDVRTPKCKRWSFVVYIHFLLMPKGPQSKGWLEKRNSSKKLRRKERRKSWTIEVGATVISPFFECASVSFENKHKNLNKATFCGKCGNQFSKCVFCKCKK